MTPRLDPESASRTSGSASNSFTLVMLFDFKSSTTLAAGNGCEAVVPQFTPTARALSAVAAKKKMIKERFGGIDEDFGLESWIVDCERKGVRAVIR